MQHQLAAITDSLESAQARLRTLADATTVDDWARRPGPDRWSAAECVEHLNLTSRAYLPLLRNALAEARLAGPAKSKRYRMDALGRLLSAMIGPLRHIGKFRFGRVKTTSEFVPRAGRSRDEILSDFVRLQGELIAVVQSADSLPIDKVSIVSPFGGRMKYNAYSALVIIHRHQHRHLDQAHEAAKK